MVKRPNISKRTANFLLVALVCLAGISSWFLLAAHRSHTDSSQSMAYAIILNRQELPAGWAVATNNPGQILLDNKTTGCSMDTLFSTDTAESHAPDVDHNQQTITAIRAKGYSVTHTPAMLTIVTTNGHRQLKAHALALTGQGDSLYQIYAYIVGKSTYSQIQLSCPHKNDLPAAESALLAVQFTR